MSLSISPIRTSAQSIPYFKPHKEHSHVLLKKIIRCLKSEKSTDILNIQNLVKTQGLLDTKEDKTAKVLKAIHSIDYSSLKKNLRQVIAQMTDEERAHLFQNALQEDFNKGDRFLGNSCFNLMSLTQLRGLAKHLSPAFVDMKTSAQELNEIVKAVKKYDREEVRTKLLKNSKPFILFRFISNLFRTIAVAFNLLELGKEPNTYFETKYMLDIYWRLLDIPLKIVTFLFHAIVNPIVRAVVVVVGSIISAIAFHVFKKCFKKSPEELPYCKNLTSEIKTGQIEPAYGREKELDEILETLAANNDIGRKHPLLIGKSGIGKTELMKGLAWRLIKNQVPAALKGKKLFYVNSAELLKAAQGFELKDPLEQIMSKIDRHQKDVIVVFDEAHNLMEKLGDRFNTILDTSANSLFYAIGITTPQHYHEKIENTNLDRRFKQITMEEASQEQTCSILRHMNQRLAPDIKVSNSLLESIYEETQERLPQRSQPDKSIFVLSEALQKVRGLQNGSQYDEDLHGLMSNKEELSSKLMRKNLNGISIQSEKIQKLMTDLKGVHVEIEATQKKIKKKQKAAMLFSQLKKQRQWHHNWLVSASEKVMQDDAKGKKLTNMLEKIYLFNSFVLIPQFDQYILDFAEKHHLVTKVDETLVTEVLDHIYRT